jgi:hypothetical protein
VCPFKATVYVVNGGGEPRQFQGCVENLGAEGLFVKLPELFEEGADLLVITRLSKSPGSDAPAPLVALYGTVVRTEPRPPGGWGHALRYRCKHFL